MRKLSPVVLALALSHLIQDEPVSEVSPVDKIDCMVSLPVTAMKAVGSIGRITFMSVNLCLYCKWLIINYEWIGVLKSVNLSIAERATLRSLCAYNRQ